MRFDQHSSLTFSSAPVVLMLIMLCIWRFDLPLANQVAEGVDRYAPYIRTTTMADLLLIVVVVLTGLSWLAYFHLRRRHIDDHRTVFFSVVGTVLPASFGMKIILKWIFGRTETHNWLLHPQLYGFHWFAGTEGFLGFPSGHMLVFTPLFLALWDFFPRFRIYYGIVWLSLGIALIVTEYHFLSDVAAGTYLGLVIYQSVSMALSRLRVSHALLSA
ncbi:MAG TPA: phosphatase PAP2 family protein [Methylophilaceae bacterium]|jgi:membrane-associated phospholipid phosphatase